MAMEQKYPLISVLMGIYYRRSNTSLLNRSIRSILEQSYSQFELLICDDGSTEEAKKLVDTFAKEDERIILFRPGNKMNLAEKLNVCLQNAKGELIARMDDDDQSHPERLEKQVRWLNVHPNIAFVGSNANLYQKMKNVGIRKVPEYPTIKDFLFCQPFLHPTLIFRQAALRKVNGYSEDRHCILCEDYDLFLRLYEEGYRGANIQESLLDYSLPEGRSSRKISHRWNETIVRYRHFKKLGLLPASSIYVLKPLAVGILPQCVVGKLRSRFMK